MTENVLVLHPVFPDDGKPDRFLKSKKITRSPQACLDEAIGLTAAIHLEVVGAELVNLKKIRPDRLFGKGVIEKISETLDELNVGLVMVDHALTPVQQRNLEKDWNVKVIDRTGLILEIFGYRAKTKEGKLQVELAALSFQKSRLVRSWTHLERQRGGFGFTGGPGETQIEIDRRLIGERIARLKKELEHVRRTRGLQRKSRQKVPYPIVALVGYTNAGKSTLFNCLTGAEVMAKDLLFATLDPTMRAIKLPSGRKVILSDTVGFISDLPTDLIVAFRATLEEIEHAAAILHVRDISQENTKVECQDVLKILNDLGVDEKTDDRVFEILNKTDLLEEEDRLACQNKAIRHEKTHAVSAITKDGVAGLLQKIDDYLNEQQETLSVDISLADGKTISWLYEHGNVLERRDDDEFAHMKVGLDPDDVSRFKKKKA